jgi:type II secretory ATPase GspE/PulE/Tfp pilus assembly ATPase PilB-like protein
VTDRRQPGQNLKHHIMSTASPPPATGPLAESAPAILEQLVRQAERAGASDIHLQMRGRTAEVAFRLDGVITPGAELSADVAERVFGRIKFLARLKTYQETLPQDGRIPHAELKSKNDLRVATYPTVTGEKIVLRLFNAETAKSLGELALPATANAELEKFLRQTTGLLLLTGPAGSGKTTTTYACLRRLAELGGRHIITVEDPVEQIVPGTMQTEINEAIGLDFARAARHLLRQDPQVLILGEIRDEATAQLAVRAGLTGHLVISTLHAGSCKGVFERLLTMCADHSAVASAVELVLNQRLIRKVCSACDGAGCESCLRTGYNGRVPLVEWLRVDDAVVAPASRRCDSEKEIPAAAAHRRDAGATTETWREQIRRRELTALVPMQTLAASARLLVNQGVTNEAEFKRVFGL